MRDKEMKYLSLTLSILNLILVVFLSCDLVNKSHENIYLKILLNQRDSINAINYNNFKQDSVRKADEPYRPDSWGVVTKNME